MLLRLIRKIIGNAILIVDNVTTPKSIQRNASEQAIIDKKTSTLQLYEMHACPFCVKVRREVKRLNLNIKRVDIKANPASKTTLIDDGGKFQVPCLRIEKAKEVSWLYESNDIIAFLRKIC